MTYNASKTWSDLDKECSNASVSMKNCILRGKDLYDEWQSFRDNRTNAQIATALSVTETQVADMDSAYSALWHIWNFAGNGTPTQGNYLYALRVFS